MRCSTVVAYVLFVLGFSGIVTVALRSSEGDAITAGTVAEDSNNQAPSESTKDRGGWVRIADEQGRLRQQYRADTLEPAPDDLGPGWIKVQGADLRLIDPNSKQEIRLRAETGELLAPSGGVQRGTLSGGVKVELRESPEANPTLTLNTSEVAFDEILGEIRAESRLVAEGDRGGFIGSKLIIRTAADGSPIRITLQSLEVLTLKETTEDQDEPKSGPSTETKPKPTAPPNTKSRDQLPRRYEAVLTDNVRVTFPGQREVQAETAITRFGGNTLTLSELPAEQRIPGRDAFLASNAVASLSEESIRVTADGPLVIVPLLASGSNESDLVLTGEPVTLREFRNDEAPIVVTGGRVEAWRSGRGRLTPGKNDQITLRDEIVIATAQALDWDRSKGDASLIGPGSVVLKDDQNTTTITFANQANIEGEAGGLRPRQVRFMPAVVSRADATLKADVLAAEFGNDGGLLAVDATGSVELNERTQRVQAGRLRAVYPESSATDNAPSLVIAEDRVVLVDSRGRRATGGRLEARPSDGWAELTGRGVSILDEDLRLEGESLQLDDLAGRVTVQGRGRLRREGDEQLRVDWSESAVFQRGAEDGDGLVQIAGNVNVRNAELRLEGAERMTLGLQSIDGKTKPEAFAAEGDVRLLFVPENAALRGERVDASFNAFGQPTELRLRGNAMVKQATREIAAEAIDARFEAGNDNQTSITSVLAETLVRVRDEERLAFGSRLDRGSDGVATLTGAPVQLVASGWAFETSGAVHLAENTTAAKADGPGSLRAFDPIALPEGLPRSAPAIPTDHTLHARWTQGLTVDASSENTLRANFLGDVEADGTPEDGERFRLRADAMLCSFDRASTVKEGRLREVILSGEARVERTTGDFSDLAPPDLLSIRSQTITMSPSGNTVNAEGPGQVVFRSSDQSEDGPFRGAGESLLEFKQELRLRPAPRERLVIELTGEVGCIHQDREGALSTLTAESLRATVSGNREGRDLSGIAAEGGVVVRTPSREVVAGRFDADLDGGLAEATATRPSRITITERANGRSWTADSILWDLEEDRIRVRGVGE